MSVTRSSVKTSSSDPLRVDWLFPECAGRGALGITLAPGKKGVGISGRWDRDLAVDVAALREMGTDVLVSLVTDEELRRFQIPELVKVCMASGINVIRFPVPDGGAPPMMAPFSRLLEDVTEALDSGKTVVAHCAGGLGRGGTIGACLLLRLRLSGTAQDAIANVRRVRSPRAIETRGQEEFIARYAAHFRKGVQ